MASIHHLSMFADKIYPANVKYANTADGFVSLLINVSYGGVK